MAKSIKVYDVPDSIIDLTIPIPIDDLTNKPYEKDTFEYKLYNHYVRGVPLPDFSPFLTTRAYYQRNSTYTHLIPSHYKDSPYMKFWGNEEHKCIHGVTEVIDGESWYIPGYLYWYWNFTPIHKTRDIGINQRTGKTMAERIYDFPDVYDTDYFWFTYLHEARQRGQHAACLKARGKGFSFKAASMITRNFYLIPRSKGYAVADSWDYLTQKDGLLVKVSEHMSFIDDYTPFVKRRQVKDTDSYRRASFKEQTDDGQLIERGYKSEIYGISLEGKPDKVRGLRGNLIIYEESGNNSCLQNAWEVSRSSVEEGGSVYGMLIAFGCVCAGSKVWTKDGRIVNIETLVQSEGICGYNGTNIEIQDVLNVTDVIIKPCYRITLEGGNYIECSEDHPLLVSKSGWGKSSNNMFRRYTTFKRTDQLVSTDIVGIIQEVPIFGTNNYPTARMIGLLIGDGYYCSDTELAVCDVEIADYVSSICSYIKDKTFTTKDNREYNRFVLKNSEWRPLLEELGIWGQSKQRKRLPNNIHEFDRKSLAELLAGYFDADGYVKVSGDKVHIILTSIVYELLEQVKYQLIKFGIHSSIVEEHPKGGFKEKREERHIIYRLYITRLDSVIRFSKEIKLLCGNKSTNLLKVRDSGRQNGVLTNGTYIDSFTGKYFSGKTNMSNVIFYQIKNIEKLGNKEVYNIAASNTHTYLVNNIITHNTGGTIGSGFTALERMTRKPDEFNIYGIPNIWERGRSSQRISFLVPDYVNRKGHMDTLGNSDIHSAIQEELAERESKKGNPSLLRQRMAEHPFTIDDAIMRVEGSPFDVSLIREQLANLDTNPIYKGAERLGKMVVKSDGTVDFKQDITVRPLTEFPTIDKEPEGCIIIYETPSTDSTGVTPFGWYVAGTDPINLGRDDVGDTYSLASTFVINRFTRRIVAEYTGRPRFVDTFYEQLRRLLVYYNCQTLLEVNIAGVFDHFNKMNSTHLIAETPSLFRDMNMNIRGIANNIGIKSDPQGQVKGLCRTLINKWTQEVVEENEEGQPIYMMYRIRSKPLLQELKDWSRTGNYDRVDALGYALLHLEQKVKHSLDKESTQRSTLADPYWNILTPNNATTQPFVITRDGTIQFLS